MNQSPDRSSTIPRPPPPMDESVEGRILPRAGEASAEIVLGSLLMLSVVGFGAVLLMRASAHAGDSQSAKTGVTSQQAETQSRSALRATRIATWTPTSMVAATTTSSSFALAPLDDVPLALGYQPKQEPNVPPHRIFVAPKPITLVRIEPDAVTTADTNPYGQP